MSAELQALLKRTQPPTPRFKKVSLEPSPYLMALVGRMEARQWRNETLLLTIEYIKQSANEINFIKHLRTCRECRVEAELSIERYYGRGLPWFLDLINDINEGCLPYYADGEDDPRFADCPRVENYKIGSYWTGSSPDTLRFLDDRSTWAEKLIRKQIKMAVDYYKLLKEWDLNGEYPLEPALPF